MRSRIQTQNTGLDYSLPSHFIHYCLIIKNAHSTIIAVCIFRYVITLGLHSKYDVDGHFRGMNPYDVRLLSYIQQLYFIHKH